jgi:hypothetical protein
MQLSDYENIIDQALLLIGEEQITFASLSQQDSLYRAISTYFLQTYLEACTDIPWLGGRLRHKFTVAETTNTENDDTVPYKYQYKLPFDFARALSITGNDYFEISGWNLVTDRESASLFYISNGNQDSVYVPQDLSEYIAPTFEPKFWSYFELVLASKLSIKLAGSAQLHTLLSNEASLTKQQAILTISAFSLSHDKGQRLWDEEFNQTQAAMLAQAQAQAQSQRQ